MGEKDYDPKMHSAEHMLNGTIAKMLGCGRAVGTHIEKKKSKIDFRFNRNMTDDEIAEAENKVNAAIDANIEVTDKYISISDARTAFDLSRLPDNVTDDIRVVSIGDYDHCPCIGSHVSYTTEIEGHVKIISTDYDAEKGILRVRFKLV